MAQSNSDNLAMFKKKQIYRKRYLYKKNNRKQNLKNGCIRVLVDGDDDFAVFHAGQMLNRSRNADCDVELLNTQLS